MGWGVDFIRDISRVFNTVSISERPCLLLIFPIDIPFIEYYK